MCNNKCKCSAHKQGYVRPHYLEGVVREQIKREQKEAFPFWKEVKGRIMDMDILIFILLFLIAVFTV
mgnify:CR=1